MRGRGIIDQLVRSLWAKSRPGGLGQIFDVHVLAGAAHEGEHPNSVGGNGRCLHRFTFLFAEGGEGAAVLGRGFGLNEPDAPAFGVDSQVVARAYGVPAGAHEPAFRL